MIESAFDATDLNRACQPETLLHLRVNGEDVPYEKADKVLYQPASERKLMLIAAIGYLVKNGHTGLTDRIEITEPLIGRNVTRSRDNIGGIDGWTKKDLGRTYTVRELLTLTEDMSAGNGAKALTLHIGKIVRLKGLLDNALEENDAATAVRFGMQLARTEIGVSARFNMVNYSGNVWFREDVFDTDNYMNGRETANARHGTNVNSVLDSCRINRYIASLPKEVADYMPRRNGYLIKTGTISFDAGVRVVSGSWQRGRNRLFATVSAPCRVEMSPVYKIRECKINYGNERMAMLRRSFENGLTMIQTPEYQAKLNDPTRSVALASAAPTVPVVN